jgi:hypothetical protein
MAYLKFHEGTSKSVKVKKKIKMPDEMLELEMLTLARNVGGNGYRWKWARKQVSQAVVEAMRGRRVRCAYCGSPIELCNHLHHGVVARHESMEKACECPHLNTQSAAAPLTDRSPS